MINRINAKISSIVVHSIGNKAMETELEFSNACFDLEDESLKDAFLKHVLDAYKEPVFYNFNQAVIDDVSNIVQEECKKVFSGASEMYESSIKIGRHLFNKSTNSSIRQSYFVMAQIEDMLIEDELVNGLVMIKLEQKEQAIKVPITETGWALALDYVYLLGKIDKCCLVLNTNEDNGYKILNIDTNKNGETKYWKDEFLKLVVQGNDYSYTSDYIKLTSNFLKNRKPLEAVIDKAEEAGVLSRSYDYFKSGNRFEEDEYKQEVFQDKQLIHAFDQYKENWQEKTQRPLAESFDPSEFALNKQSKVFRSVIKLDKNFHIYVHGDTNKIMKGVDEDGKKYYILYYNEEN